MNTFRLKNITILILAMTNAFLLFLLVGRNMQERAAHERTAAQLVQLFASSGMELVETQVPTEPLRLSSVDPMRSLDAEADFAAALLGACEAEDVGGGIYRYVGSGGGQCLLRASGTVEAKPERFVDDPAVFCGALFSAHGYEEISADLDAAGSGTVTAVRTLSDVMVFNAALTLRFEENRLAAVDGSFVPDVDMGGFGDNIDGVTALVRFLDYIAAAGEVCTAVTDVRGGYLLQSTASASQRLIPAWCVTTDVSRYYVNASTGEVSRAA